jgi:small ligand-binding sensory domain FIST
MTPTRPPLFPYGHATHPDAGMAVALVLAQLKAQMAGGEGYARQPGVGVLYLTEALAPQASGMVLALRSALPFVTRWVGSTGMGVLANGAEYVGEPALAVMLLDIAADECRVFSGRSPLSGAVRDGFSAATALVHADGRTPDVAGLLAELAEQMSSGYVFGGLAVGEGVVPSVAVDGPAPAQARVCADAQAAVPGVAAAAHAGVWTGGLTGLAFGPGVRLLSRVTQGCCPVGARHTITEARGQVIYTLDHEPALDVLMDELGVGGERPHNAVERLRSTLVGLSPPAQPVNPGESALVRRQLGDDQVVRHLIGVDPVRHGVAVAEAVVAGQTLVFCQRNAQTARADLVRMCTEIREALETDDAGAESGAGSQGDSDSRGGDPAASASAGQGAWPRRVLGALYISCAGRTGAHFGAPGAEMAIIRHALGDVPLVGMFAGGEIAHHRLYGYTGVLTVFVGV